MTRISEGIGHHGPASVLLVLLLLLLLLLSWIWSLRKVVSERFAVVILLARALLADHWRMARLRNLKGIWRVVRAGRLTGSCSACVAISLVAVRTHLKTVVNLAVDVEIFSHTRKSFFPGGR